MLPRVSWRILYGVIALATFWAAPANSKDYVYGSCVPASDFQEWIAKYKVGERACNIENAKQLGVKNPEAILDAYEKNLVKWRKLEKEIGTDVEKFADTLWKEI